MLIVADRLPPAVGVNVTVIVQEEPAATDVQLFVCLKSPLSAPDRATVETVKLLMLPLFVTVTVCDALVVPTA